MVFRKYIIIKAGSLRYYRIEKGEGAGDILLTLVQYKEMHPGSLFGRYLKYPGKMIGSQISLKDSAPAQRTSLLWYSQYYQHIHNPDYILFGRFAGTDSDKGEHNPLIQSSSIRYDRIRTKNHL